MSVTIFNPYRHSIPRVPFLRLAKLVVGNSYDVSVVFIRAENMKKLNRTYRTKNESTDILSFPLSKRHGELYISMRDVRKKAALRGMSVTDYFPYLVLHGMVHLRGLDHGKTMTAAEKKYAKTLRLRIPD